MNHLQCQTYTWLMLYAFAIISHYSYMLEKFFNCKGSPFLLQILNKPFSFNWLLFLLNHQLNSLGMYTSASVTPSAFLVSCWSFFPLDGGERRGTVVSQSHEICSATCWAIHYGQSWIKRCIRRWAAWYLHNDNHSQGIFFPTFLIRKSESSEITHYRQIYTAFTWKQIIIKVVLNKSWPRILTSDS